MDVITKHLIDVNLSLEGKDQIITNIFNIVEEFKCKIVLWEKQLKKDYLTRFSKCNMNKLSFNDTAS